MSKARGLGWLAVIALVAYYYPVPHQRPGTSPPNSQVTVQTEPDTSRSRQSVVQQVEEPAAPSQQTSGEVLQGRASAVDGDTIEINGTRVRFNGIDAPEYDQQCEDAKRFRYSCGWQVKASLEKFMASSRPMRCEFVTWDQYGRFIGNCFRADGADVAAWLVKNGLALDLPKYSHGAYATQQLTAKAAKRGLWKGFFEEPWTWRAEQAARSSQPLGIISSQAQASGFSCQPKRTCSQISLCDEANWYLSNCSWGGKLDRDKDGIPCESLC